MLFTIIMSFNPLQPDKAQCPILVTEFGIVTDVKLLHVEYLYITVYQCLPS